MKTIIMLMIILGVPLYIIASTLRKINTKITDCQLDIFKMLEQLIEQSQHTFENINDKLNDLGFKK